jgi:hypothetical protein
MLTGHGHEDCYLDVFSDVAGFDVHSERGSTISDGIEEAKGDHGDNDVSGNQENHSNHDSSPDDERSPLSHIADNEQNPAAEQ